MTWTLPLKIVRALFLALPVVLTPTLSFSEEILDVEHSHYRQQVLRIREALEKGKQENALQSLLEDARRTARWIFAETQAAETEEDRMRRRISKEFFELNLPVLIHLLPSHPFLLQKSTAYSIRVTDFESGMISARVTVPYFTDSGLEKARNEGVFLSILLIREGILALPVQESLPLSKTIPPEAKESGGIIAQYIIQNGITPKALTVKIHKLAAGGGIALVQISLPIPLHIGNRLSLEIARTDASKIMDIPHPPETLLPPTGLLLDLRGLRIRPFRDPILISESRQSLMIPDVGRPSDSLPFGWAGWSDGQNAEALDKRVGVRPLMVRPVGFLHHQVFVLSHHDAALVQRDLFPTKLLSSGHILLLLDSQQVVLSPRQPPSPKGPAR